MGDATRKGAYFGSLTSVARGNEEMRGDGPASILDVLAPILAVSYPGDGARLLTGSEAGSSPALPASRPARSRDQAGLISFQCHNLT